MSNKERTSDPSRNWVKIHVDGRWEVIYSACKHGVDMKEHCPECETSNQESRSDA